MKVSDSNNPLCPSVEVKRLAPAPVSALIDIAYSCTLALAYSTTLVSRSVSGSEERQLQ
jgi:hypothetical protein